MSELIIIGNSGAARECYWIFMDILRHTPEKAASHRFKGFLRWQGYAGDLKELSDRLLGEAQAHVPADGEEFVIGIGQPALRKQVYEAFKAKGASFMTLRHPFVDIAPTADIGEGNIFQMGVTVFCNATVGNANYLNGSVNLAHDVVCGDYNFIGPNALLLGECRIGSENIIGAQCCLLPKAKVGNGNSIAPASVLYKGCGDHRRMMGNPAFSVGDARQCV